jgi:hypothetical protein
MVTFFAAQPLRRVRCTWCGRLIRFVQMGRDIVVATHYKPRDAEERNELP